MRLLYVIDSLAPGGAETSLAAMAAPLADNGIDLHVLPLGARRDLAPALEAAGATVHHPQAGRGRLSNVKSVVDAARSIRPDLIHTTLFESDVAGRVAAALLRIPSSSSIVSDSYSEPHYAESNRVKLHLARALDGSTARLATRFHAISDAIARSVAPRIGLSPSSITVIPRGRAPEDFPFLPSDLRLSTRRELGLGTNQRVILALGRQEPPKGLQHLLAALPLVGAQHPNLTVLLAGREGRSTANLLEIAAKLSLDIRFLGAREEVPALLAAADVLCFPSEREGFGGVLIEAMAVGCPIVASDIPASREVIGRGSDSAGLLTPVGDVQELAEALTLALGGTPEIRAAVDTARTRFETKYSIQRVAEQMADYFRRTAAQAAFGEAE